MKGTTTIELKDDAYKVIVRKQTEILNTKGIKIPIRDIVEQAILIGIDGVDE